MKTSSVSRVLALSAFAAGALVAPVHPAVAAAPGPIDVTFDAPCPDFVAVLSGVGKVKAIELPGDRQIIIFPGLRVTITGPTGKSVSYVATGANKVQILPDGSQFFTATGRNVVTVPEANGHPAGVFLTIGTVSWTLNPDGSEKGGMFSGKGTVTDVCRLVAP